MSSQRSERTVTDSLLDAIIGLAAHLELGQVLQSFVDASVELTGARYGAINILDTSGTSTTFLQTGVSEQIASKMASAPHNTGVLARIPPHGVLRLADLTKHSAFIGFPDEHPVMGPFLGTAVRVREQIFGYLYLADKDGGFDDDDDRIVRSLAAGVGVAIQNAQLYAEANRRQHWLEAGQEITTMLLSGVDQDEALEHIAATARTVANADTCALVLPGIDGELILEIVDGYLADALLGLHLPRGGRSHTVMLDGIGMVVDSLSTARNLQVDALRHFGPAMYAPLEHEGAGVGVLVLLRRNGGQTFSATDLATAESFAAQAALALVLDEARALLDRGHRELVVTGCNLACYRDGTRGLPELADALCRMAPEGRIRLGSVEPGMIELELADVMRRHRNLCRFLHLPIQTGDDALLRRMGRRYSTDLLRATLAALLQRVPGLALGTDLITGLPGEDEAAFGRTRELLQAFPFANLHVFPYSPRPGTRAATMSARPPAAVARARARQLRAIGDTLRRQFAAASVGQPIEVLIEGRDDTGLVHGWSDTYLPCRFTDCQTPIGHLATFTPVRVEGDLLVGA